MEFRRVLDKIILLELKANPDYLVNYQPLTTFEDLLGCVKRAAKRLQSQSQTGDHVTLAGQHRIPKLPPIEIPEFNGDIKNWPLFISSFRNVVHNNTSLTDSEKLYYL
ncbi:DUF1759 domain-containing protein, partial [Pseudomonas aeruginosa]